MTERRERGSVLALVPAGFLVLMVLAALAVDSAVAYLGQQKLHDTLAAAATDAATAGLDNGSFYRAGTLNLDPAQVGRTACLSIAAQGYAGLHGLRVWMAVDGSRVVLTATATVDPVFGRVMTGLSQYRVRATAVAVAANGPVRGPVPTTSALQSLNCG